MDSLGLVIPSDIPKLEDALNRSPGIRIGRSGRRGRVWHFWRKSNDPKYPYLAIGCGFKVRTIKSSVRWMYEREFCEKCAIALIEQAIQ